MKFHDFSPFYRSGEGIRSKVAGDRLIDNPAVADAQGGSGASFSFDGTDDVVTVSDDASMDDIFDDGGTVSAWIYPRSDGESSYGRIVDKAKWIVYVGNEADSKVSILFYYFFSGDNGQWSSTLSVPINEWSHVTVMYDNGNVANQPTIYLNGVSLSLTVNSTPTSVRTTDDGSALKVGNDLATDDTFDGQISQVRLHNRALTADEVRASYNGQAVGFEYRGASQDSLITGVDADWGTDQPYTGNTADRVTFNSNYGWDVYGLPLNISVDTNVLTYTTTNAGHGIYYQNILEAGKNYRLTINVSSISAGGTLNLSTYDGSDYQDYPLAAGSNTVEFTHPGGTNLNLMIRGLGTYSLDASSVSTSFVKIGCVAEYLPESISDSSWLDSSGNELDGSVSGATAVNAEAGIVGRDSHLLESKTVADLQSGASFNFDGVNDVVTSSSPVDAYPITMGCWFKTSASSAAVMLALVDASASNVYYNLQLNNSGQAEMEVRNTSSFAASSTSSYNDNEWHNAVLVMSSATSRTLYVDGISIATDDDSVAFNTAV
ncbi:uncharacterized protein METZ01_LOCUS113755, partial [marine metagenome]